MPTATNVYIDYVIFKESICSRYIKRYGHVSVLKCMRENRTVYLYASRRVASTSDY